MSKNKIELLQKALIDEKKAKVLIEKKLDITNNEYFELFTKFKKANIELEGFFNNIMDAYVVMNLKGHVIKMNHAAEDLFGYNIKKERLNVIDLIYKEDEEKAYNTFFDLSEKGFYTNYTSRAITKNKEIKWVQVNASLIYDNDNIPIGAQGIIRDITQNKQAENLLIESKNRLSSLILNLDSGIAMIDSKNKIVLTNEKFCRLLKIPLSPKDLVGLSFFNIIENTIGLFVNKESKLEEIEALIKNKKQILGKALLLNDGTILERDFIPLNHGNGDSGFLWTYKDISLRKKYQKSIDRQRSKYSNIIANMNLGLVEIDVKGQILMVNHRLCSMSGFSENELKGKRVGKIFPVNKDNIGVTNDTESIPNSYEIRVRDKKRNMKHWLISNAPNYDLKGKVTGYIGICLDITELKELENQKGLILKELEKSNSELQEYAHIVSHDLKSPLRSINALTNWIKADNKDKFDEITNENFNLIESTLEKMDSLISDILIFSSAGNQDKKQKQVNLNEVIIGLLSMLYIPENISIKITKELPNIYGDKTKFQQLFQNLISNAIKFNDKQKGLIEIDVVDNTSFYQFSVKDNGIGIEKKYHDKIFKIFHSLQESVDSTGIGLSIVKKIVDLYNGEIWLESKPKKGTTFYFTIKK